MVSPFIATPFDYLSRAARSEAKGGLGPAYQDFLANLPEARLAVNPPSRLYPTRKRGDLIAQFLGSPVRDVSRSQAAYYAAQGDERNMTATADEALPELPLFCPGVGCSCPSESTMPPGDGGASATADRRPPLQL